MGQWKSLAPIINSNSKMAPQVTPNFDIGKLTASLPVHKDFKQVIEYALGNFTESWWIQLPILCCDAVGGAQEHGELLAEAVGLAATAAEILDDIQDGDTHNALWRQIGIAPALNVGISLIFAGQVLLARLEEYGVSPAVVCTLQQRYVHVGLTMCSGQHHDLAGDLLSLDKYWEMATAKTGTFAAWCCEAGAIVGNPDISTVNFAAFGHHLGVLHQLKNDMQGLYGWAGKRDLMDGKRTTLPLVYAFSVAPIVVKETLEELLKADTAEAHRSIRTVILHDLGLAAFAKMVIERHHALASDALRNLNLVPQIFDSLQILLDRAAFYVHPDAPLA